MTPSVYSSVASPVQLFSRKLRLVKGLASTLSGRGMLIAIDAGVEYGDALAAGALKGSKLLMLDAKRDSIQQITEAVHRTSVTSVHIVTHGSSGCLHFSSGDLTLDNLHTYAAQIESWFCYRPFRRRSTIKVQPHDSFLSLYACNLAKDEAGLAFLENLHHLVGVSIHTAKGKVGSTAQGGSWQLDVSFPFPHRAEFPFTDDLLETYATVI
ncbi:MAG: DUF4347 domain-containing protein [Cyanobacteria bacterium J06560_2]